MPACITSSPTAAALRTVVPAKATVWYLRPVRNDHAGVERNFAWLRDIADGAAKMTRTTVSLQIDTDCHEIIPNDPRPALLLDELERVGPPKFTPEEETFARRLQESVTQEIPARFSKLAIDDEVHRTPKPRRGSGSTDVGDISWRIRRAGCGRPASPPIRPDTVANVAANRLHDRPKREIQLCRQSVGLHDARFIGKTRKRSPRPNSIRQPDGEIASTSP